MDWPDLEALILGRLMPRLKVVMDPTGVHHLDGGVDVELDAIEAGQWYVRITLLGGTDNGLTDRSRVDVETFAPSRADAMDLGNATRTIMHSLSGTAEPSGAGLIDRVRTSQRPMKLPYRNDKTSRVGASYDVETRLQ